MVKRFLTALYSILHQNNQYRTDNHNDGAHHFLGDIFFAEKPVSEKDAYNDGELKQRQSVANGHIIKDIIGGELHGADAPD